MNERLTSLALTCTGELGIEGCGASGILMSENYILTHGSLLNARITSNPRIREFFENLKPGELTSLPMKLREDTKVRIYQQRSCTFDVSTDNNNNNNNNNNDNDNGNSNNKVRVTVEKSSLNYVTSMKASCSTEIVENDGTTVVAWRCPLLANTLGDFFFNWSFDKTRKIHFSSFTTFLIVLLKKKTLDDHSSFDTELKRVRRALERFVENSVIPLRDPARSFNVEISSTPFGNPVFIDTISRGVVSNVFGNDGCVMLTDANAVPGSEGAPVYVTRSDSTRSHICGMVIAPLSWCRGEWVDYTFAACLLPCLRRLLLPHATVDHRIIDRPETRIADSLDRSLVLVRCGDGWGTGIIFDARTGTIITCSHVVHKAPESRIKVVLRRDDDSQSSGPSTTTTTSSSSWAKLVYRTVSGEPYDVAILKLDDPRKIGPTLRSIKIADYQSIVRGETVGSAGFPFFSSRLATITRGNVSGITECMLRTTCCVQSGSSGGPIVRWSNGEMLGMIVCNAIATDKTKLYPRLNMAVPVSILVPPISEYLRTGDVKALDALGSHDPSVRRTWNFHRLPSSKI